MIASDLSRAVAAYGLTGTRLRPLARVLSQDQWSRLFTVVCEQRLTGLLMAAIDEGVFAVTVGQAEEAAAAQVESMHLALVLEQLLLRLADGLERSEVDYRVLKGPVYARLVYPDPTLRPFGDIDILVRGEQFEAAAVVLARAGASRTVPELGPGFDRRFGKGATFRTAWGDEIDLHRTFIFGPFGIRMRAAELFVTSDRFVVAGRAMPALVPEARFMHACFHAQLGSSTPRLLPLRDVAQMALTGPLDLSAVSTLARSWRAEAVVATAVRKAWRVFDLAAVPDIAAWAEGYQLTRDERLALSVYGDRSSYLTQAAASLGSIRGVREKGAFVRYLALSTAARRPGAPRRAKRIWDGSRLIVPGLRRL